MTRHYCTLFDTFYMTRGLAMIESLVKFQPSAQIAIFAFDKTAEETLKNLSLPQVTVIGLADFETPALLRVKASRKRGEYCWTCTPFVIAHCLEKLAWRECTYLDADLFFFSSPEPAFAEDPEASILITEHRYTPRYDQTATSGRYCVQFVYFRNDDRGREALSWWGERCLEWCHDYFEDGKFGDQKYLDDWETRFSSVHSIQNEGVGLAPWNVQKYQVSESQNGLQIRTKIGLLIPVVFYHFHALKFLANNQFDLSTYVLPNSARNKIYIPYLWSISKWQDQLRETFQIEVPPSPAPNLLQKLHRARAGFPNIVALGRF